MIDLILVRIPQPQGSSTHDEELHRAKDQLKGNILMGLESSNSRMANLARQEMYFHQFFSMKESHRHGGKVSAEQVMEMAQILFKPERWP